MVTKKRKLIDRLRDKYKLVILNDETYEEKASLTLSRMSVFIGVCFLAMLLIFITALVLVFTPLKEYIPGYSDLSLRKDVTEAAFKTDSLQAVVNARDRYLHNIERILKGEPVDTGHYSGRKQNNTASPHKIDLSPSASDSAFRAFVEQQERFDINSKIAAKKKKNSIGDYTFFTPVKGMVTQKFNLDGKHYGIDIACKKDEAIKAILDGTVIFANFTIKTGYVVAIQHENNMISFYKHCSALFKKAGNFVKSGEAIAVVGNTGELSTGPHLHFELWYNGSPVDPNKYMRF